VREGASPRAIVCNTLKGFDWYARLQLGAKPIRPFRFSARGGMKLEFDVEHVLTQGPGYWYLSTPFTHFPGGRDLAFQQARRRRPRDNHSLEDDCWQSGVSKVRAISKT
jgi:hypothetical protein